MHKLNLKVYIAGPMTGLPDNNYPAFDKAEFELRNQGHTPLNPALNKGTRWIDFMRRSLEQIAQADAMYMLKDWQISKGAKIEHQLALDLHLPIFYENELAPKKSDTGPKFDLQDNEQYRCQMAGISTASFGYWKEGDSIHPDYDTVPLRDVAKLYAKYEALSKKYDALLGSTANVIATATKEVSPGVKEGWTTTQAALAEQVVKAAYADPDHPSTGTEIPKVKDRYTVAALDVSGHWVAVGESSDDYAKIERSAVSLSLAAPGLPVRVLPLKKTV